MLLITLIKFARVCARRPANLRATSVERSGSLSAARLDNFKISCALSLATPTDSQRCFVVSWRRGQVFGRWMPKNWRLCIAHWLLFHASLTTDCDVNCSVDDWRVRGRGFPLPMIDGETPCRRIKRVVLLFVRMEDIESSWSAGRMGLVAVIGRTTLPNASRIRTARRDAAQPQHNQTNQPTKLH